MRLAKNYASRRGVVLLMQMIARTRGEFDGRAPRDTRAYKPRVCMPIFSSFARNVYRTGVYEAQDVIAGCDDVELVYLEPSRGFEFREKWLSRLLNHDVSGRSASLNPGLRPVRLTKEYDLFVHVCAEHPDLMYANAIEGWRDRCRTSVCWIGELWSRQLPLGEGWLAALRKFDFVIVGTDGTGKSLGETLRRPCHEMIGGVDAIRFSPYPNPTPRLIDVYSVGRRWEGIHQSLLKMAAEKKDLLHSRHD